MSTEAAPPGQPETPESRRDRAFFGHPKGLANLFGVEMWERFSFYGMQFILAYYLYFSIADGGLALPKSSAVSIVGAYGGLVYLSTVLGSWISDRLLGPERTLFSSAVLVLAGHVALAVLPGLAGVGTGLVMVAVGSGGLKANATVLVGLLYATGDERRDAGFSLFYMGVNLGAFVGPLVTGLLQSRIGFHFGFGAAAIGMAAGLVQYVLSRRHLPSQGWVVPTPLPARGKRVAAGIALAAIAAVVLATLSGLLTASNLSSTVTVVIVAAAAAYFVVILASGRTEQLERKRVFAFIPLFLTSFVFWSLFQQQFTVLTVYAEQRLDLDAFGWEIPAAWVGSVQPIYIVVLAPVFAAIWTKLGARQPSTPIKFALGAIGMGLAFLLMVTQAGSQGAVVHPLFIVLVLLVFSLAELFLSPVGLSVSTKLAPRAFEAQLVALFYLSVAAGSSVAGWAAQWYSVDNEAAYFGTLGGVAILLGLLMLAGTPGVKKLMSGVR